MPKLTVKQVRDREGVSLALVYAWIKSGLPHFRFGKRGKGGKIMVDEEDLEAWLASCRVEAVASSPPPRKPRPKLSHFTLK